MRSSPHPMRSPPCPQRASALSAAAAAKRQILHRPRHGCHAWSFSRLAASVPVTIIRIQRAPGGMVSASSWRPATAAPEQAARRRLEHTFAESAPNVKPIHRAFRTPLRRSQWALFLHPGGYAYRTAPALLSGHQVVAGVAAVELDRDKTGAGALSSRLRQRRHGAHATACLGGAPDYAVWPAQTFGADVSPCRQALARAEYRIARVITGRRRRPPRRSGEPDRGDAKTLRLTRNRLGIGFAPGGHSATWRVYSVHRSAGPPRPRRQPTTITARRPPACVP